MQKECIAAPGIKYVGSAIGTDHPKWIPALKVQSFSPLNHSVERKLETSIVEYPGNPAIKNLENNNPPPIKDNLLITTYRSKYLSFLVNEALIT